MQNKKLKGADYLLLLLFLDNKAPILGAVRLEKMIFLFNNEISSKLKENGLESEKLASFIAHNFGPFSKDIYEQIEFFRGIGFVKVTNLNSNNELEEIDEWEESTFIDEIWNDEKGISIPNRKFMKYELTKVGEDYVNEKLISSISDKQFEMLEKFKKQIEKISIKDLLHYVYVNYPEYTKNSLIKDEVLNSE
jgi:uncharacterized protein